NLRRKTSAHILNNQLKARPVGQYAQVAPLPKRIPGPLASKFSWARTIVLTGLIGWLYFSIILHLAGQWWQDPNFSHGFFVPAFALFVLWQDRGRLAGFVPAPSIWGLGIIVSALSVLVIGVLGAELFLSRVSFLVLLPRLLFYCRC